MKYAEDQHRKKELNRLQNLTTSNSYRPMGMPQVPMQDDHRTHPHHLVLSKQDPVQSYYYQQQNLNAGYGGAHSPIHSTMLQHPHSPIYTAPVHPVHPSMMDYHNGGDKSMDNSKPRGGMQNKNIPFPLELSDDAVGHQNSWYSAMSPQHMYHNSVQDMHSLGMGMSPPTSPQHIHPHTLQHQQQLQTGHLQLRLPGGRGPNGGPRLGPHSPPQSPSSLTSPYSVGPVCLDLTNLPSDADVALLYELFTPYGRILNAQVEPIRPPPPSADGSTDPSKMCIGRGKVQMAGFAQAEYAANSLNGAIIFEGAVPIQVYMPLTCTYNFLLTTISLISPITHITHISTPLLSLLSFSLSRTQVEISPTGFGTSEP